MDFYEFFTVQVFNNSLFAFQHWTNYPRFVQYTLHKSGRGAKARADPPTPRFSPSLVNYHDLYIFVSGGENPRKNTEKLTSVDRYDIANDRWSPSGAVPPLNQKRHSHSSCTLGDFIYVCCGYDGSLFLSSIERLNVKALHASRLAVPQDWAFLCLKQPLDSETFKGRRNTLFAPISDKDLIILGGMGKLGRMGSGYIVDIELMSMERVFDDMGFRFGTESNQCQPITLTQQVQQIAGLVTDQNNSMHLIAYKRGQPKVTILQKIGKYQ